MRFLIPLFFFILSAIYGCDSREQKLRKKESELQQKEQELLLKEKELEIRENQLKIGSVTNVDAIGTNTASKNMAITGLWAVKMSCIETDCDGSAIGDTKNEHWEISYQNNTILAKARTNNKLVRVYTGKQSGKTFELSAEQNAVEKNPAAKIIVKLKLTSTDKMEGRREIFREGCRIIYSLELTKQ